MTIADFKRPKLELPNGANKLLLHSCCAPCSGEVMEALRQNNIASPADVKYAAIEPSGQMSYVLKPKKQPVTAEMLNLSPADSGLPLIVVNDGKPVLGNLKQLNLEVDDLEKRIKKANVPCITDVFLMTLDDCGNQFIQRKEG